MRVFQGKTVLVTGGSGFIGVNLVRWLRRAGYRVVNLDKLTYAAVPGSLQDLESDPAYIFVKGDIGDRTLVREILKQYQPSGIVHLAAESHVDRSILNAEDFVQTNVVGTYRLLDEALHYWQSLQSTAREAFRFIHVSTDEVFGDLGEEGYFTEESPYAPNSPYSASKAAGDHFARAYWRTYGLPVIITNSSNNYGPYQHPEKLIPLMIFNALQGRPLPIYGDGGNVRDWIYVEDHCRALHTILEKGQPGEQYLIGSHNERRNFDLVQTLCSLLDEMFPPQDNPALATQGIEQYADLIRFVSDRPGHDRRYAIDARKLRESLGWRPLVSLEEGLRRTVRWYLENLDWVQRASHGAFEDWLVQNYAWRQEEST